MVTRAVDLVIALDAVNRFVALLEAAGFTSERFAWSVNPNGRSAVGGLDSAVDRGLLSGLSNACGAGRRARHPFASGIPGGHAGRENEGLGRALPSPDQTGQRLHRHRQAGRRTPPPLVETQSRLAEARAAA